MVELSPFPQHIYMHIYIYVHTCMHIYIRTYIHAIYTSNKQTTQTNKPTNKQTNKETHTHTYAHSDDLIFTLTLSCKLRQADDTNLNINPRAIVSLQIFLPLVHYF